MQVVFGQVVCEQVVCGQVVCVGRAGGRTGSGRKRAEVHNQKQEPHTKMWGTNKKLWKDPPFLMGKSTISMVIFNSKLFVYPRVGS